MGGYGIKNDSGFRNGNGRGYRKITRDGGFGSGDGGRYRKWSGYESGNGFGVDSGSEWSSGRGRSEHEMHDRDRQR